MVVSDRRDAAARRRAEERGIPTVYLPFMGRQSEERRAAYGEALTRVLGAFAPDLVVLAGWMVVLPPNFLQAWPEAINLHPALLEEGPEEMASFSDGSRYPPLRGTGAIRRAYEAGHRWTGVTVHRVTTEVDRGPVILREEVPIHPGEPLEALEARVHAVEHRLLPEAIRRVIAEREKSRGGFT